jgi:CBS-domain-containing membrane protein
VLNNKDELVGILSMRDLKNCLSDMDYLCELIVAAHIMSKNVYCLVPDDTLETAFEVFEGKHISTLPVVDSRNRKKVLGILKKSNAILKKCPTPIFFLENDMICIIFLYLGDKSSCCMEGSTLWIKHYACQYGPPLP